ncbi:hypothetical protein ACZ91_67550 [Streptomyces regensis]|nr:hypothetical protein ACZ91_67550 [Streptomyces regensis]
MTWKPIRFHVSSLSSSDSTTATSTQRRLLTISRRSASGTTGGLPLSSLTRSSVATPTMRRSQCRRAWRRMLRWPMWNRS